MNLTQYRMARVALAWSLEDVAERSGVDRRSIVRFEAEGAVSPDTIERLRSTLEAAGVRFLMNGPDRGGVVPPRPAPIEDQSGGNPSLPR